jgi:hypothetical protein
MRKSFDKWLERSFLSKQDLSGWAREAMYVAYIAGVRRGKRIARDTGAEHG